MSTVLRLRNPALVHRKENTPLGHSNWGKLSEWKALIYVIRTTGGLEAASF